MPRPQIENHASITPEENSVTHLAKLRDRHQWSAHVCHLESADGSGFIGEANRHVLLA